MSLQASKVGSSPLMIDWSQMQVNTLSTEAITKAWNQAKTRLSKAESGFYDAPVKEEIHQNAASAELAKKLLGSEKFKDCLFLGIGGSALGPIALLTAVEHLRKTKLKFHFVENPDATDWNFRLSGLNPDSTLVVVVTKSGTTYETVAQFLIAQSWLKKERWPTNLVVITDPVKGDLRAWASKNQIMTLPIHPSVGGRFSIFTPVGLFAAHLAGLDATKFLKGAESVRSVCETSAPEKNPLFTLAYRIHSLSDRHPVHVLMPYSTRLKLIGQWWVQLWGESLGKDSKGYTPVAAVGATDQHSLLQLLRDGPNDKITGFVTVDQVPDSAPIPSQSLGPFSSFEQLRGKNLHDLLTFEHRSVVRVLSGRSRPCFTLQLERLDEASVGALCFAFCVITAFTAELLGVNPYDQPGVEESKLYIREFLR